MENGLSTKLDKTEINGLSIHEDNKSVKVPSQTWIAKIIDNLVDNTMPVLYKTQLDVANKNMKKIVDYIMRHL